MLALLIALALLCLMWERAVHRSRRMAVATGMAVLWALVILPPLVEAIFIATFAGLVLWLTWLLR